MRQEILERIRQGVPAGTAAMSCGVHRRTFQRWLELGRREDAREPYKAFALQIEEAFSHWQVAKISEVDAAGVKDWRSAAWMLERLVPEDFADQTRVGGTVVNLTVVEQERSQLADRMAAAAVRVLGGDPELLERFMAELAGGVVVDGEAVEVVGEIAA